MLDKLELQVLTDVDLEQLRQSVIREIDEAEEDLVLILKEVLKRKERKFNVN